MSRPLALRNALAEIDRQLEVSGRKRYGQATVVVAGSVLHIWAYRAVLRRDGKAELYNRYAYAIDGTRVSARAVSALFKQEKNHE